MDSEIKQTVAHFTIAGMKSLIADAVGDNHWILKIGGALINLGPREEWSVEIAPLPHSWRISISFKDSVNRTIWFDVSEKDARTVESAIEGNL